MNTKKENLLLDSDLYALATILRNHRPWHAREQWAYPLHPVVFTALKLSRPRDWHQLVLEWPHAALKDHGRIAYTRDERKGLENVQTVTTAGKYLSRHWPMLKDSTIRDMVAEHIVRMEGCCKFLDATTHEIVRSVEEGPVSCMRFAGDDDGEETLEEIGVHPYTVYAPELGWRAAVRLNSNGDIVGRVLVHDGTHMRGRDTNRAVFVRTYRCADDVPHSREYSHADEKLEAWLVSQNVGKRSEWPLGTPLRHVTGHSNHRTVVPYLDGGRQHVSTEASDTVLYIMDDGDGEGLSCDNTDGTGDYVEGTTPRRSCDCCNSPTDDEDLYYIEHDERDVCSSCLNASYTRVTCGDYVLDEYVASTRSGDLSWDSRGDTPDNVYLIENGRFEGDYESDEYVVFDVYGGTWHVNDIDATNGIVHLCADSHDAGEYIDADEAVEIDGEWFHIEHDKTNGHIVKLDCGPAAGNYVRADVAIRCGFGVGTGFWHEDDVWQGDADSVERPTEPVLPMTNYVHLHNTSSRAGEIVDINDALLAQDVGWFTLGDLAAGTIVRITDDVFALATDLVTA